MAAIRLPSELNDLSVDVSLSGVQRGDLLYHGSDSKWRNLAASTSGLVLQTNGAGQDPSWVTLSTQYLPLTGGTVSGDVTLSGRVVTGVPPSVTSDSLLLNNTLSAWLDETNKRLSWKFKDSTGTARTVGRPYGATELTDQATLTTDASENSVFTCDLSGSRTLGAPSNPQFDTQDITWRLKNTTGSQITVTLNTGAGGFRGVGALAGVSTIDIDAGEWIYLFARWNANDSKWDALAY